MSSTFVFVVVFFALCYHAETKRGLGRAPQHGMPSFASFISTYGRTYANGSAEYEQRQELYEQRIAEAGRHNRQPDRRWNAGINDLWDRTEAEMAALRGWHGGANSVKTGQLRSSVGAAHNSVNLNQALTKETLPTEVTWRRLKAMDMHMDQRSCGSCWAVASAWVLQAHSEIYSQNTARTFSIQELVSCVPNPRKCGGTGGCEGATIELALDYVMKNGLHNEKDVPYRATDRRCTAAVTSNSTMASSLRQRRDSVQPAALSVDSGGIAFGMSGWEKLPENKYEPLMRALVENGPVGVSVAANSWFSYSAGVFDQCKKDAVINHAVTLFGYGEQVGGGDKWWQIKNSWGRGWGENGNIRLLRRDDDESHCGTDRQPQDGSGCEGGPKEVTVCGMCGILYDTAVPHFIGDGSEAKKQSLLSA